MLRRCLYSKYKLNVHILNSMLRCCLYSKYKLNVHILNSSGHSHDSKFFFGNQSSCLGTLDIFDCVFHTCAYLLTHMVFVPTARLAAQRYTLTYQEPIPVEQLIINVCDRKQGYTQFGGLRPFGVSFCKYLICVCR
jgi:hypothetical protein